MILRTRAKNFLTQPIPKEIRYVPGSIAELVIETYAAGGKFDEELLELGELCTMTIDEVVESHVTPEAQDYFRECKSILEAILVEERAKSC
jgi:hypothetical protein